MYTGDVIAVFKSHVYCTRDVLPASLYVASTLNNKIHDTKKVSKCVIISIKNIVFQVTDTEVMSQIIHTKTQSAFSARANLNVLTLQVKK